MVPFERALVSYYRPSGIRTNFSSVFTRFKDCYFCAPPRHFLPTPLLISPKFPHVPLGVGLIVCLISFQDFQTICDHNPCTNVTDRRADRRTTCDLETIVHRAVKNLSDYNYTVHSHV